MDRSQGRPEGDRRHVPTSTPKVNHEKLINNAGSIFKIKQAHLPSRNSGLTDQLHRIVHEPRRALPPGRDCRGAPACASPSTTGPATTWLVCNPRSRHHARSPASRSDATRRSRRRSPTCAHPGDAVRASWWSDRNGGSSSCAGAARRSCPGAPVRARGRRGLRGRVAWSA